jgi:hypothetical protein
LRQIDHQQRAGATPKTLDFQLQEPSPSLANRANPAHQVASLIPAFERASFASAPEHESIGADRQRIFARFDQDRLCGGL